MKRGEVYWVHLDPTLGTEIRKTRPALIVSPDDMNAVLPRIIVAPITSAGRPLGWRPTLRFKGKRARVLLDQLRHVDKRRLGERLGNIPPNVWLPTFLAMLG